MTREQRFSIIIDLVDGLHEHGSWCGETHVQKTAFVLNSLIGSVLPYDFILYKHGPFSFELRSELIDMRGVNALAFSFPQKGYGPSLVVTSFGRKIRERVAIEIEGYNEALEFVVAWLGESDVRSLERIATALYFLVNYPNETAEEKAERMHGEKPHISLDEAGNFIRLVEDKMDEIGERKIVGSHIQPFARLNVN